MLFGAIRSIIRPASRALICSRTPTSTFSKPLFSATFNNELHPLFGSLHQSRLLWRGPSRWLMKNLIDSRFPKMRPLDKRTRRRNARLKRMAKLKPLDPYAWVKHVPGEPLPSKQFGVGDVKRRNERKREQQRRAFMLAEKKKRKAQVQEAKRKKKIANSERKVAAVARDRAWVERLGQLQQRGKDKKAASMT